MFKTEANTNEVDTIIGPSVKVEGDFVTEGNMIVEGTICGSIKTNKNLKVGSQAKIFASIAAENALIAGEIQGNISVPGKIELTATAKIYGDIKVGNLTVASGALINGKCQMNDNKSRTVKPEFSKQKKLDLKTEIEDGQEIKK